jgi:hypothetical protein
VVNPRLALLALVFIIASATLEAVNSYNYLAPLITFTLPEYLNAFDAEQRQALARAAIRFWAYGFSVSLMFFGVFCVLIGTLILKSKFLPWLLGVLMVLAGMAYWIDSLRLSSNGRRSPTFCGSPSSPKTRSPCGFSSSA